MSRVAPTKQQLNQAIRADILGGDYLLDLLNYLHIVRRYDLTDECRGFLDFIRNRLTCIRARMRESVIDKTDPTATCKSIADEVIQDLRQRLKDPRYCKRKKLKADHVVYCKKFRDALIGFVDVLEGRLVRVDGEWVGR
jgi:ethanolamine utilization cobalamin adenosyltransferase